MALERQVTQGCLTNNDPLARHVDSASTVRDMEQFRRAMGLSQFNYMGRSYGTFLGYRYAKLYPGRLRAMVLDAAIDRGDWILSFVTQVFLQPGDITFNSVDQLVYESSLGDASLARYLYDAATSVVDPNGTYAPDNQANRVITCVDTRWSQTLRSAADLQQLLQQAKASAPRFGEASVAQGPVNTYRVADPGKPLHQANWLRPYQL